MRHRKVGRKLGRNQSHRDALFSNLAVSLVAHRKVHTTEAKARELRPLIERLVSVGKQGTTHARRQVFATLRDKKATKTLVEEIAPQFAEVPGGYTRLTKVGPRVGDAAPMAFIEFVSKEQAPKAPRRRRRRRKAGEGQVPMGQPMTEE